jgi:hypothetical protein
MPIGVIAAGVTAAGAIGGGLLAAGASRSAANTAANAQQQATQGQLQLGREQMGQARDIYNANYAMLSPFVGRGDVAGQSINALLGLPTAPTMTSPLATASGSQGVDGIAGYNGPSMAEIQGMQHDGIQHNYANALAAYNTARQAAHNAPAPAATPAATTPAVTPMSAQDAFNNFANSAGMQFQLDQGEKAINSGYAAHGQLQSGAAMKALQGYGQQTALNNYFLPYMGLLGGQQSTGAQSGAAVAGVGSNFSNTAAGISGQMGNALQNGADATGNAALLRGQANSQLYSSLGSSLGNLAGSVFGSHPAASMPTPYYGPSPVSIQSQPAMSSINYPMPSSLGFGY